MLDTHKNDVISKGLVIKECDHFTFTSYTPRCKESCLPSGTWPVAIVSVLRLLRVSNLLSVAASSVQEQDNSTCSAPKPPSSWIGCWQAFEYSASCLHRYPLLRPCTVARGVWVAVRVTYTASQARRTTRWAVRGSTTIFWGTKWSWRGLTAVRGPLPIRTIMFRPSGERWLWFWICGGQQAQGRRKRVRTRVKKVFRAP